MYLPAGWIAIEVVTKGVLVYGVRKSLMIRSAEHLASYNVLMSLYSLAGKNTDKMTLAASHLESIADDSE